VTTGAPLGKPHRAKPPRGQWRPGSSEAYRPVPALRGEAAEKLWRAKEVTNASMTTLMLEMLRRLEVDEEGWPLDEHGRRLFIGGDDQEVLPLTG
jgi:hypothetical protein